MKKFWQQVRSLGKYLGSEKGAISLGGAVAPAATPQATDANNPNIRRFDVTALDADTGPTAFNHGVQCPVGSVPICFITPAYAGAATVVNSGWGITATATQVTLSKPNLVDSGTGHAPQGVLTVWNIHSLIK